MGKRTGFARNALDQYNTPAEAVRPLLNWLEPGTRFIEPCLGEGALCDPLQAAGHHFIRGFDLPIDARSHRYAVAPGEIFITNPPYWGQPWDLHPLIENLSNQAPTWLLMYADWLFNKSSGPLTKRLRKIVAVGRVKWIPGSKFTGYENTAWLLFDHRPVDTRRQFFVGRTS